MAKNYAPYVQPARKPVSSDLLRPERDGEPGAIQIGGREYLYRSITVPACCGVKKCVRVARETKAGWDSYDVSLLADGRIDCTCGDQTFRGPRDGRICKHAQACRELGVLDDSVAWDFDDARTSAGMPVCCPGCGHPLLVDRQTGESACWDCTFFVAGPVEDSPEPQSAAMEAAA